MTANSKITHKARTFERFAGIIDNTLRDGQFFFREFGGTREECPLKGSEFRDVRSFNDGKFDVVSLYFNVYFQDRAPNALAVDKVTMQGLGLDAIELGTTNLHELTFQGYIQKTLRVQLSRELVSGQRAKAVAKKGNVNREIAEYAAEILAKRTREYKAQLSECSRLERQIAALKRKHEVAKRRLNIVGDRLKDKFKAELAA